MRVGTGSRTYGLKVGSRRTALVVALAAVVCVPAAVAVRLVVEAGQDVQYASVGSAADLVGAWRAQDGDGRIRLDADGRFTAVSLPGDLFTRGSGAAGAASAPGTWELIGNSRVALVGAGSTDARTPGGLAVVARGHSRYLCVTSGSPGVLCDLLLEQVSS